MGHTAETPFEAHRFVVHVKVAHGTGRYVQHNLPVTGKTLGYLNRRKFGIDQHVRGAIVVHNPLIERADQVRSTGVHQRLLKP
ncbi:hypothetical protein PD374_04815 [Pseudomonas sp. WCS374]|nr:hypothetical protein PD374_04815 [Pseudomonas sp. WCS374]